ncbi:MAG: 6-bladed beta-propeller [Neobacillus sp.]
MKRRNVYIGMALIALSTAAVFTFLFLNSTKAIDKGLLNVLNPDGAPQFSHQLNGDFETSLNKPMDVASSNSFIYVTDTNNKRVVVFDLSGAPIFNFGEQGNKEGQFNFPYGIAVDSNNRVFVADLYNGNISIFDEKGKFIDYFAPQYSKDKVISSPGGLRIIDNKVYLTDIESSKAFVFSMEGELILEVGAPGSEDGQFIAPNAITADKEGNIYVVDSGNQRVQVFNKDGEFVSIINGSKGGGGSAFVNPRGIGIDQRGIIYVVSNLTHIIYGFNQEGNQVFQFGSMGEANGQFYLPNGLFIDEKDNVYITDTLNQRVSVFK